MLEAGWDTLASMPLNHRPNFPPAVVTMVKDLCTEMMELPAPANTAQSGKLYERVITKALACRFATAPTDHKPADTFERCGLPDCVIRPCPSLQPRVIECFPRAAEQLLSGAWRNEHCSVMPTAATGPFFTVFTDSHTLVNDGMITLDSSCGRLAIGLQMKE